MPKKKASRKRQRAVTSKRKGTPQVELQIPKEELKRLNQQEKLAFLKEKLFHNTKVMIVRESEISGSEDLRVVLAMQTTPF